MKDESGDRGRLQGANILLIEDNMLIALDSQDSLLDAGASEVHIAAASADVRAALAAGRRFDAAVLDLHLGHETGLALVETLELAGIPFMFSSGLSGDNVIPPELSRVPMLGKPYAPHHLVSAVASVLGRT